jgi:hypothetical protein
VSPTAPQSTGAAGATSTTVGAGAATTTTRPRPCTIQDFGATDIGWVSGPTGQPYPDRAAPAGEPTRFVVSVWAKPGTPCMTQAWGQELTVTDATGAVVYQRVHDEGPGRLTEPGRWVLYDGWFGWDPSCAEAAPDGWTTPVCLPVGAGSYLAQLVVAGAALPSLAVSFVAP